MRGFFIYCGLNLRLLRGLLANLPYHGACHVALKVIVLGMTTYLAHRVRDV